MLLPAPDGPTTVSHRPSGTDSDRSSNTVCSPCRKATDSNSTPWPSGITGSVACGSGSVRSSTSSLASSPRAARSLPPRSASDSSGSAQRAASTRTVSSSAAPMCPPSARYAPRPSTAVNSACTVSVRPTAPGSADGVERREARWTRRRESSRSRKRSAVRPPARRTGCAQRYSMTRPVACDRHQGEGASHRAGVLIAQYPQQHGDHRRSSSRCSKRVRGHVFVPPAVPCVVTAAHPLPLNPPAAGYATGRRTSRPSRAVRGAPRTR